MGKRLRAGVRGADVVARLGGDEFVVLLTEVSDAAGAETVARKLLQRLTAPIALDAAEVTVGASIGVALFPDDACDAETLLRCADLAMYAAKEAGRRGVARYETALANALDERVRLHERLQQALAHGQAGLQLHYQPQYELQAGRVTTVEALLRWHDPVLGPVAPQRCIAVAESTGLIVPLGDWVLEQACAQAYRWREQGAGVRVAVNLSAQQVRCADLVQRVVAALQRHGLPHEATDAAVVRGVARLARLLRLQTVAEGVETAQQGQQLRRHGIDALQGWLLAPALPAGEVERWFGPAADAWARQHLGASRATIAA